MAANRLVTQGNQNQHRATDNRGENPQVKEEGTGKMQIPEERQLQVSRVTGQEGETPNPRPRPVRQARINP